MRQILFRLGLRPRPLWGDYSGRPEPLAGRGWPISKGIGGREGKRMGEIEKGKGRKGRGRNVAFHHLLLSNLTTGQKKCQKRLLPSTERGFIVSSKVRVKLNGGREQEKVRKIEVTFYRDDVSL